MAHTRDAQRLQPCGKGAVGMDQMGIELVLGGYELHIQ